MTKEEKKQYMLDWNHSKMGLLKRHYHGMKHREKCRGLELSFSMQDYIEKYENDKKFNRLYNEWVKSNYATSKAPTVDRINPKKGYSLQNISPLSWEDNRYKQRMEIKRLNNKPVIATKDGVVVHRFYSQNDAARKLGLSQSRIGACCRGELRTSGGFVWEFAFKENNGKPIRQLKSVKPSKLSKEIS